MNQIEIRHAYQIAIDSWVIQVVIPVGVMDFMHQNEEIEAIKKAFQVALNERFPSKNRGGA